MTEPIPAATVVLLRDAHDGGAPEALMLRKNAGQAFGGMWVFPGGKVESGDGEVGAAPLDAARHAAVREAAEETGVVLPEADLVPFAHWLPPREAPKRYATYFFVAALPEGAEEVVVDGGEIGDHVWTTAEAALRRHAAGEIELAPPTWMTLRTVVGWGLDPLDAVAAAARGDIEFYETRVAESGGDLVTLWRGDAGYETGDAEAPGARRRLVMARTGWRYEEA